MSDHLQLSLFDLSEPPPNVYPAAFLTSGLTAPSLVSIRVSGLKSFDDTTVKLSDLTVLTGPNNSGKSTILQGIALGYECLRRCVDSKKWKLLESGRSVPEFEFLPVNEPKDLWYKRVWKPSRDSERPIEITLNFDGGYSLNFNIRFIFGFLNIKLAEKHGDFNESLLKGLLANTPILVPATSGPSPHEDLLTLATVHRYLSIREPSRVIRNILWRLQSEKDVGAIRFVNNVLQHYFQVSLSEMSFDEKFDLELRSPIAQEDYSLDIVSSGSGLNQILQLACIVAWRKPSLLLLDEPDAHLHSSVQIQLFDFLNSLVHNHNIQIILSTHSRDLISQAPLESIVPVDSNRRELIPLHSIEHLLLEYQRFGGLSNVDLALLYQTKSCLFVEGVTDVRMLPRIAEKLDVPVFIGSHQLIPFEFQGVDKLKYLPELVKLLERLIGSKIKWGVIRDADLSLPRIQEIYRDIGGKLGATYFHLWQRHSIENYLLEPQLLHAAISGKYPKQSISLDEVSNCLEEAIKSVNESVYGPLVTKAQHAYKEYKLSDNPHDEGAAEAARFIKGIVTSEQKRTIYPGKKIFGKFVEELQNRYKMTIRLDDVISSITRESISEEVVSELFNMYKAFIAE